MRGGVLHFRARTRESEIELLLSVVTQAGRGLTPWQVPPAAGRAPENRVSVSGFVSRIPAGVIRFFSPRSFAAIALAPALVMAAHAGSYTVHRGDTLRGIAQRYCGSADDWGSLASASGIRDANVIRVGQRVTLSCHGGAPARDVQTTAYVKVKSSGVAGCIISRESGGNPRAVNPYSGAGGLFQFLPSTWRSLGFSGLPEYAPVATQWAAFDKEVALAGYSAWTPYDGCLQIVTKGDKTMIDNMHVMIGGGLAALALLLGWVAVAWLLAARRERAAPALWSTALVGDRPMPEWDGQTWDWPEGHLGEYIFGDQYAGHGGQPEPPLARPCQPHDAPVRPNPSPGGQSAPGPDGPHQHQAHDEPIHHGAYQRELFPDDETDRYIDAMRDWTTAFITAMSQPALAPAGSPPGW
jgi:resuscitation-promoting factor RpfC